MSPKIAIAALIICVASPKPCNASTQWNWSLLPGDSKASALYVDKSRIEEADSIREVWTLLDSKRALTEFMRSQNHIQVPYFSLVTLQRIDCTKHTIALLSWAEYMDHLGAGAVVASAEVSPKDIQPNSIVPGSIGASVAMAVC